MLRNGFAAVWLPVSGKAGTGHFSSSVFSSKKELQIIFEGRKTKFKFVSLLATTPKNEIYMHKHDFNRVEFFSKENLASGYYLSKGEHILRSETKSDYEDINDILELYNIKQYLDNELYLKSWTQNDIEEFKQKAIDYAKIVGQFMSKISDSNIVSYYEQLLHGYINSFWELINNQKIYKQISEDRFKSILNNNPHEIRCILTFHNLVDRYNTAIRDFLLAHSQSGQVLLSIYEEKNDLNSSKKMYLPQCLTILDKEQILLNYIDSEECNLNYLRLIKNARDKSDFKISDKTRLKAKRKEKKETDELFEERKNIIFQKYGVSISFPLNTKKIKSGYFKDSVLYLSYSLNYITENKDFHSLFINFKVLFEYLDIQNRIALVNKENQMDVMERVIGIRSQNEYRRGIAFNMSEMTSQAQIVAYCTVINNLGESLEDILQSVFTSIFQDEYNFEKNARLLMPSKTVSYFEKVRFLAPEFESVLKQYKLFVDDGFVDFELLQMSSLPCSIKDIPSLNHNKYVYLNEDNKEIVSCSNLFFSDQTLLAYVEPYKEKRYHNFFDLLANELVDFSNYEEHQKPQLNYLINNGCINIDERNFIQITNIPRILILKDLYDNEVASFYNYPEEYQEEAKQMKNLNMIYFESSLFSKPEQSYFNYYLNKSEFTNGLDLRNSYLHGTQADPKELNKHENAYFSYLKLLVLVLLKIEDDLLIKQDN